MNDKNTEDIRTKVIADRMRRTKEMNDTQGKEQRYSGLKKAEVHYKVWDCIEREYFRDYAGHYLRFSLSAADQFKGDRLDSGMYPNNGHTVFEIHQFLDGKFTQVIKHY